MNEEVAGPAPSQRLAELGLTLPPVAVPLAAYIPAIASAGQVLTSGQLPTVQGALVATGKVGAEVTVEQATQAARVAVLNALAAAASEVGGIDNIRRVVRMVVYVAGTPDFTAQPQVANGASELLGEIFGPLGRHVRSAVGVASLPLDAPVELELVVEASAASF
ncbi:RidA family protein [Micropruina sp.]|uniref:RidA family protein n=1 Tax=Micropruina sp. TaxID=2737536 RepID=UPI00262C75FD|nr:RidA family protein [Micropruina sp.]